MGRHRCFEVETPGGVTVRINGDPHMPEETLTALLTLFDRAYAAAVAQATTPGSESMTDLDDIRERWAGKEWTYHESQKGQRIGAVDLLENGVPLVEILYPSEADRALLARFAATAADVQALLGDIDAAREALDDQAPTLWAAVQSVSRNQQQLISAYRENEMRLHRRAEQAEADAAVLRNAGRAAATILFALAQSQALDLETRATIRQTLIVLDDAIGRRAGYEGGSE